MQTQKKRIQILDSDIRKSNKRWITASTNNKQQAN